VIRSIDVLVVPSRWYENSPNVIQEAFEMKRPVIVTNLGGMAEMVDHEHSGLVFKLNKVDDLSRQIQRLLHEPSLLASLRSGIPAVKRIHEEMQEVYEHYQRLVSAN
jgi:glycosyltransferase involved in cell wall biosynthesis